MRIILFNSRIFALNLPAKVDGSFALQDIPNSDELIANIESKGGKWQLSSVNGFKIFDNNSELENTFLEPEHFYLLSNGSQKKLIYTENSFDESFKVYDVVQNTQFVIGKNTDNQICYSNNYVLGQHCALFYKDGAWSVQLANNSSIYINEKYVKEQQNQLRNGDVLYLYGLKIIVMPGTIIINNPGGKVVLKPGMFNERTIEQVEPSYGEVKELDYYSEEDYFFKTPRLRRFIETYDLKFAKPPSPQEKEEQPLILTLGPSLTMGVMSVTMLINTIINIASGQTSVGQSVTRIVSGVAMLASSLLWPNLIRRYQKKRDKENEQVRQEKYHAYLDKKAKEMIAEGINQSQILKENLLSMDECYSTIVNKKRTLWERKITQKDFLTVRVGTGDIPIDMDIEYSDDEFTIEEDSLVTDAHNVVERNNKLLGVPVGYSFYNKKATAIMGINDKLYKFIDNVILQLASYHSYDDLKIVILTDKNNEPEWEKFKSLPHCFSNNKEIRFFASDIDEMKTVSTYLEQEFISRFPNQDVPSKSEKVENEDEDNKVTYSPYYLIFTDNFSKVRRLGISELILKNEENMGFGFAIIENSLGKLPSECINFITIGNQTSGILRNDLDDYYHQDFNDEINAKLDIAKCCESLANIPIEFYEDVRMLPKSFGFLEMQKVGKVEQLNSLNRWRLNDPTKSLRAAIGVNDSSNTVYLDLHEKFHGPHGLIAGMTGSGKSEFIITYILSMCLNYSPNEVSFILIDYKGGGLAGAFENKTNNIRLPHLAGTITNLDKGELNRTLVSIDSELRRRQSLFNDARDKLGESTIDIYKYQKFFRQKKLDIPIPHLFIVCDEFAELKSQQPDFMDNLISTARIGRSLGVHLILATQKPSGVVNDQIWSNTKFRVCLKVQDRSDSNEMLKRPEAAEIKEPGRFYLQVGYNELFILGQSGWAGTPYSPSDTVNTEVDKSISYLDNVGSSIKDYEENMVTKTQTANLGDELSNVLKYVTALAKRENVEAPRLWLDNVPETIYVDSLLQKYKYQAQPWKIEAVVGEYDDPSNQKQGLVTVDLSNNTAIYGTSGSNREMFLNAMIYSLCTTHSSEEVNFYIFDFGSESMRMFKDLPHMGDIVTSAEDEKLAKLNKMIADELETRKALFSDYNGEYDIYCKTSGKTLPRKVFIFNNFDSYREMFPNCDDILVRYSREGLRYGITIVFTANSSSGLYGRMLRNFENVYVLDMPNRDQYFNILGKLGNVYPAQFEGRGLFRNGIVFEYQTAQIYPVERLIEFIKRKTYEIKQRNTYYADKIPVLPDVLTLDTILSKGVSIKAMPLGMYRDSLELCMLNLETDKGNMLLSNEIETPANFIWNFGKTARVGNIKTMLIDAEKLMEDKAADFDTYINDNLTEEITKFNEHCKEEGVVLEKTIVIIYGVDKYKSKLDSKVFTEFIATVKGNSAFELIACDTGYKFKKFLFESWFTENFVNANGIWIGSGLNDQGVIRITDTNKKYRARITNDFAWLMKNGAGDLFKLVNEGEENEK